MAPILFAAVMGAAFAYVATVIPATTIYECPNNCLGIIRVEDENAIETVNLKTGKHQEWRFRATPPVTPHALFKGYVVEFTFIEHGDYQSPDINNHLFHIVRGKELQHPAYFPVSLVTYFDGPDRPVLAKNCRNTADDQDVICEGGDAQFGTEISQR